jgi:hypothetical protein
MPLTATRQTPIHGIFKGVVLSLKARTIYAFVFVNICRNSYSNELYYISSATSCIENIIVTQPVCWCG